MARDTECNDLLATSQQRWADAWAAFPTARCPLVGHRPAATARAVALMQPPMYLWATGHPDIAVNADIIPVCGEHVAVAYRAGYVVTWPDGQVTS